MPQRSTEESLYTLMHRGYIPTVVSLDIEGAFDSTWWPAIRVRLVQEKSPANLRLLVDSYLNQRSVRVRYAGEEHEK